MKIICNLTHIMQKVRKVKKTTAPVPHWDVCCSLVFKMNWPGGGVIFIYGHHNKLGWPIHFITLLVIV